MPSCEIPEGIDVLLRKKLVRVAFLASDVFTAEDSSRGALTGSSRKFHYDPAPRL